MQAGDPADMAIPRCVVSAEEAIGIIRDHHARWLVAQQGCG
jgi:hypothetical protein